MTIKINDRFTLSRDKYQFILEEFGTIIINRDSKDGLKGETRFGLIKTTYHPSLDTLFLSMLDRSPETATTLQEVMDYLKETRREIKSICKKLQINFPVTKQERKKRSDAGEEEQLTDE